MIERQILFFNRFFGEPLNFPTQGVPPSVGFTTDKKRWLRCDVVVFHLPGLPIALVKAMALLKPKRQRWVLWSMECEVNHPYLLDPSLRRHFDLTMTYHWDADIPVPYFNEQTLLDFRRPAQDKPQENVVCAFISSPINASGRLDYLRELMQHMDIHSYGQKLNNRQIKNDTGYASKRAILPSYKFCLAFENAICQDYVTEKFFDPLIAGCVPVYLGAPNVADVAPAADAYINVAQWPAPRELADFLRSLARDETQYQKYLQWKRQPLQDSLLALTDKIKGDTFVRLSQLVADLPRASGGRA